MPVVIHLLGDSFTKIATSCIILNTRAYENIDVGAVYSK